MHRPMLPWEISLYHLRQLPRVYQSFPGFWNRSSNDYSCLEVPSLYRPLVLKTVLITLFRHMVIQFATTFPDQVRIRTVSLVLEFNSRIVFMLLQFCKVLWGKQSACRISLTFVVTPLWVVFSLSARGIKAPKLLVWVMIPLPFRPGVALRSSLLPMACSHVVLQQGSCSGSEGTNKLPHLTWSFIAFIKSLMLQQLKWITTVPHFL